MRAARAARKKEHDGHLREHVDDHCRRDHAFRRVGQGNGFNVHTTGVVLIVVGVVAAVLSIAFWASWGGFSRRTIVVRGARRTVLGEPTVTPDRERDLL